MYVFRLGAASRNSGGNKPRDTLSRHTSCPGSATALHHAPDKPIGLPTTLRKTTRKPWHSASRISSLLRLPSVLRRAERNLLLTPSDSTRKIGTSCLFRRYFFTTWQKACPLSGVCLHSLHSTGPAAIRCASATRLLCQPNWSLPKPHSLPLHSHPRSTTPTLLRWTSRGPRSSPLAVRQFQILLPNPRPRREGHGKGWHPQVLLGPPLGLAPGMLRCHERDYVTVSWGARLS
jgi:hypothetical protein